VEDKNLIAINASKELNDKIIKVETESRKHWEQVITLQEELEHLMQQLYQERDRMEDVAIEAARLKEEKTALEEELLSREFALQERGEEIRRLEEAVGELGLHSHNL
jgi:chromosome segregation ATPase